MAKIMKAEYQQMSGKGATYLHTPPRAEAGGRTARCAAWRGLARLAASPRRTRMQRHNCFPPRVRLRSITDGTGGTA